MMNNETAIYQSRKILFPEIWLNKKSSIFPMYKYQICLPINWEEIGLPKVLAFCVELAESVALISVFDK